MFLEDVIKLLVDAGVGVYGTTIFQSSNAKLPPASSTTSFLVLVEYGGAQPQELHESTDTPAYEFPFAQVTARGSSRSSSQALAVAAYNVLSKNPATGKKRQNFTINNTYYVRLTCKQQPTLDLGPDEVGRIKYGFNIEAMKRPSQTAPLPIPPWTQGGWIQ